MSRTAFPFVATDVSALARALKRELEDCPQPPGHLQLLNMLTRAAGYRNFQHFRAQATAAGHLDRRAAALEGATPQAVDLMRVARTARCFDAAGRLTRWPPKESQRRLCLWVLWSRFPAGAVLAERQVNDLLNRHHLFGDPALLRRDLVDHGLVTRSRDGRQYRRLEGPPPAEALALLRHLKDMPAGRQGARREGGSDAP